MAKLLNGGLKLLADIAGLALVVLMTMTVADIIGRHLGLFALRGTIELSTGVTVLIGFCAFPFSFLLGGHLVLDTFTTFLPARISKAVDAFWYLCAAAMFSGVAYFTWKSLIDVYEANETSMDLQIPMVWLWVPAAVGITLSPIACLLGARARAMGAVDRSEPQ